MVEDSCDVLDSYLRGTRTGTRSDISVTSFARGHSITAASNGGMIAVDDPEWFDQTLVRRRWGRHSERYLFGSKQGDDDRFGTLADGTPYDMVFLFEDMGYNFEPSEIGAAYGNVQLDRLAEFNERRQQNFARLDEVLALHEDKVVRAAHHPRGRHHLDALPVPARATGIDRTAMQEFLLERGIPSRMVWTGNILRQPGFADIAHRAPDRRAPQRRPGDGPRPHAAVAPRPHQRRGRPHRRVARGLPARSASDAVGWSSLSESAVSAASEEPMADYMFVDADNHYYEAEDAFIRHGDEDVKRYVRWVSEGKRRYMVFGSTMIGLANTSVPNPTFNPIATPGAFHARLKELQERSHGVTGIPLTDMHSAYGQLEQLPEGYRVNHARIDMIDEQNVERCLLFPTLGDCVEGLMHDNVPMAYKVFHAFNLWLEEDWGYAYKDRLYAPPYIPMLDPDLAADELEFLLEQGRQGGVDPARARPTAARPPTRRGTASGR